MACWLSCRGLGSCEDDPVMLTIPDIRQRESYDCGAAAVDAVAEFFGLRKRGPLASVRTALGSLANPVQGTSPETVCAMLRALGLAVLSGTMTVEDLRHLTRSGRPVLCPIDWAGGHWVTVAGVGRGRVRFMCPERGPSSVPVATWESVWRDRSETGTAFVNWGIAVMRG